MLATASIPVTVLTRSEWPGDQVYPELLAAFVMPNETAVSGLLRDAGSILKEWSGSPSIDGYQRDSAEAVLEQAAAIYGALAKQEVQYVSPPASFESTGQRVRLPGQIEASRQAACLDLSLFVAAALESAGLYPIVVLVEGHAFCGAFLEERSWPESTTDDVARLRNEIRLSDLVVFDPTCAVAGNASSFDDAKRVAEKHLESDDKFRVAVDVQRARRANVRPMSSLADPTVRQGTYGSRTELHSRSRPAGTPAQLSPFANDVAWLCERSRKARPASRPGSGAFLISLFATASSTSPRRGRSSA